MADWDPVDRDPAAPEWNIIHSSGWFRGGWFIVGWFYEFEWLANQWETIHRDPD